MPAAESLGRCRSCGAALAGPILDLGRQPSADALVDPGAPSETEIRHPLALALCPDCKLVQLAFGRPPGGLSHGHGTAFSTTVLGHILGWYDELAALVRQDPTRLIVDVAAGGGHLLRPFLQADLPVRALEADPARAAMCRAAGIPTLVGRVGTQSATRLAAEGGRAGLVLVNHALAHVDDLADAAAGIALMLAPGGTAIIEFHHLAGLVAGGQFDVVCHAHRSYASLVALRPVLARAGLAVIDARPLVIHGGSVRIQAVPRDEIDRREDPAGRARVEAIVAAEQAAGLDRLDGFDGLARRAPFACARLRAFLQEARTDGLTVAGYGAPSRASTLLNAARITTDLLPFTVDRAPEKQGRCLPGCRIPIRAPEAIEVTRPDRILILPWTLRDEIVDQLAVARTWGGRFVVPLPELRVLS